MKDGTVLLQRSPAPGSCGAVQRRYENHADLRLPFAELLDKALQIPSENGKRRPALPVSGADQNDQHIHRNPCQEFRMPRRQRNVLHSHIHHVPVFETPEQKRKRTLDRRSIQTPHHRISIDHAPRRIRRRLLKHRFVIHGQSAHIHRIRQRKHDLVGVHRSVRRQFQEIVQGGSRRTVPVLRRRKGPLLRPDPVHIIQTDAVPRNMPPVKSRVTKTDPDAFRIRLEPEPNPRIVVLRMVGMRNHPVEPDIARP